MFSGWLPCCGFYFRRLLSRQPVAFSFLSGCTIVFFVSLIMYVQQWRGGDAAQSEWLLLNQKFRDIGRGADQGKTAKPDLPAFNNTQLVDVLNRVAEESKLSLDEVSFVLEENAAQPYLRYRATLTVSSAYPTIRRFLEQVRVRQPQVSLDTINCSRDDITTVELTCDLVMSAFYRKEGHG